MKYLDTFPTFNNILDSYEDFGAPNNMCLQAENLTCLWNDLLHPGNVIQAAVGQLVFDKLSRRGSDLHIG